MYPILKLHFWSPAKRVLYLGIINCITQIMTLPIFHKLYQTLRLPKLTADQFHNVNVPYLIVPANVIDLANLAMLKDYVDCIVFPPRLFS